MDKNMYENTRLILLLIIAGLLTLVGVALLIAGFVCPPLGEISNSVLIAFGEVSSFVGALLGIDYTYRYKLYKFKNFKEFRD